MTSAVDSVADLLDRLDYHKMPAIRLRRWADPDSHRGCMDVEALVAAWGDPEIARWNPVPAELSPEHAARWIAGTRSQTVTSPSIDVVLCGPDGMLIGELGLQVDHDRMLAEIGFWVASEHRGRGHGLTLVCLAEQLAPMLGIRRSIAVTHTENDSAVRVLQRAEWPEVATTTADRRAFVFKSPR